MISIFLILSMTASLTLIPNVRATVGLDIATFGFISVGPSPVGVGQTVHLNFWVDKPTPTANGAYGDRWQNLKVTVTKPGGTTEVLGPFIADDTGGTYTTYVPSTAGNYTFVFSFPGQTITGSNPAPTGTSDPAAIGTYFEPCTSSPVYLTVQQNPIPSYPSTPLPTNYWQTPVFAMNTGWNGISGNWLSTGLASRLNNAFNASENFDPYTTAPATAHIMWTKPYAIGGLIGGNYGVAGSDQYTNYYSTPQYEPKFTPPIIINGVLYYNLYPGSSTSLEGWVAVDLYTGQTLWTQNYTTINLRMGQVLDYVSPNQYGGLAYLWGNNGNTWSMFDAMTGDWILSITGAPNGPQFMLDSSGNLIAYYINSTAGTQIIQGQPVTTPKGGAMLQCWNATEAIEYPTGYIPGLTAIQWQWRPGQGTSIPWSSGIMWAAAVATTITEPNGTAVALSPALGYTTYSQDITGNDIVLFAVPGISGTYSGGLTSWQPGWDIEAGYSLTTGAQLWIVNRTQVPDTRLGEWPCFNSGEYIMPNFEMMSISGFSSSTGKQLWGPVYLNSTGDEWGNYQAYPLMAYGIVYVADLGGYVYAVNATTGARLWTWNTGSGTYATPYNVFPLWSMALVAGGDLFVFGGHEYSPPLFPGGQLYCINATTGNLNWSILNFPISNGPTTAIADGILTLPNAYDNQIYAFGKGPSQTTVTAPLVGVTTSTPVTITGSVTDISAGSQQTAVAANFPNGLPCVSDAKHEPVHGGSLRAAANANQRNRGTCNNLRYRQQQQQQKHRHDNDRRQRQLRLDMDT